MATEKPTTKRAMLYTLADPRRPEVVRYIGWTSQNPQQRLASHLCDARNHTIQNYKARWLRLLLANGLKPIQRMIAILEVHEAPDCERRYISVLRAEGVRLVNGTDGGEGSLNPSPEMRARKAEATRKQMASPEARSILRMASLGNKHALGRKHTLEAREKMKAAIQQRTSKTEMQEKMGEMARKAWADPKVRAKLAVANLGQRATPETCAKRAESMRNRPPFTAEHCANISKAARNRPPVSIETRAKLAEAGRIVWARKKGVC